MEKELEQIKLDSTEFSIFMIDRINDLVNKLDHVKASKLSYSVDRLKTFIHELNRFEL